MPQMAIRRTMWVERTRTLAYCLLALMVAATIGVLAATKPAHAAATFAVNSTADTEDTTPEGICDSDPMEETVTCTLREAIQEANFVSGGDTINFAIPSSSDSNCNATTGVCTIRPFLELPPITDTVAINGYTQPGTIANTSTTNTTSAALKIVLGGGLAGPSSGLHIDAPNVVVRGLVINGWDNYGIDISGAGSGTRIEGNFIGTDVTGALDAGNRVEGVRVEGASGVTIGGTTPDKRNLISGNGDATTAGHGIEINSGFSGGVATDNKVQGNLIGTNANGTNTPDDLGNTGWGVLMAAPNNSVGGTESGAANTIAFNDRDGVVVLFNGSTGNRILSNSIFSNGELGIDLSGGTENVSGVTANDRKDPDIGANNLQNYPKLTSATTVSGTTTTTIKGTLNSRPRKTFTIQFFSSQTADPSGFGEGKTFLGEIQVKTNRFGKRSFSFPKVLPSGENVVSATATNNLTGDTSEFSNAVTAS